VEVRCPVCHRRERWAADGAREVLLEGGNRRPASSPTRAAFDLLAAAPEGDAVVGRCRCGLPLVGPDEVLGWPQSTPYSLALDEGTLVATGHDVLLDGAAVDWPALTHAVHGRLPALEPDGATLLERAFAGGLLTFMLVPIALWGAAVFVVFVFYRQFATEGVPVGMP